MKLSQMLLFFLLLLSLLTGCSNYRLDIVKQTITPELLASTFVKSPDPRQKHPSHGEELFISWRLHPDELQPPLHLIVDLIFCDLSQKRLSYSLFKKNGMINYVLLDEEYEKTGGLLTYKAKIINRHNELLQKWSPLFWVDLITIDNK